MLKKIRILKRIFIEACLGLWHSGWLNVFIVTILMSTLLVFGIMLELSLGLKKVAGFLGSKTEFSVHFAPEADMNSIISQLEQVSEIKSLRLRTKEENWKQTLDFLQIQLDESLNKMPNTLIIKVSKVRYVDGVIEKIKEVGGTQIESFEYVPAMVKRLHMIKNTLILLGTLTSLLLASATFIINFNTIELVIRARKEEIDLLNFMGVDKWYIKGPFIFQGVIYGIGGAVLGIFTLLFINSIFITTHNQDMNVLKVLYPDVSDLLKISAILLLTSVIFSSFSSLWATEKRLKI